MSGSAFARIGTLLSAVLIADPALSGVPVWSDRTRPIPAAATSGIVVRLLSAAATQTTLGTLDWVTQYAIEVYAKPSTPAGSAAAAADALLCSAWAAVQTMDANSLATLGVVSVDTQSEVDWQMDETETATVSAAFKVHVMHVTNTQSLEPRA